MWPIFKRKRVNKNIFEINQKLEFTGKYFIAALKSIFKDQKEIIIKSVNIWRLSAEKWGT